VSAGSLHTCGLKTDSTVACWGRNAYGEATPPEGAFARVSAGVDHTCGLRTDGTLVCWPFPTPPTGKFTDVSTGGDVACALEADASVACWGGIGIAQTPR